MTVRLHAHSTSGSMILDIDVSFGADDLDSGLRLIRQAAGDAAPIFEDPDSIEVRQRRAV